LKTLLAAPHVKTDGHVIRSGQRWPRQPKQPGDAGRVRLAVARELPGARPEDHWMRMCYARLSHQREKPKR
jgi:hypothetical protein